MNNIRNIDRNFASSFFSIHFPFTFITRMAAILDNETIIRFLAFSFWQDFSEGACHPGPLSLCLGGQQRYPSLHKRGGGSCLRSGRSAPVKLVSLFACERRIGEKSDARRTERGKIPRVRRSRAWEKILSFALENFRLFLSLSWNNLSWKYS